MDHGQSLRSGPRQKEDSQELDSSLVSQAREWKIRYAKATNMHQNWSYGPASFLFWIGREMQLTQ